MTPKKDKDGTVTVELTKPEEAVLRKAWSVLDQMAYHLNATDEGDKIAIAADTVSTIVDPPVPSEA